ncbi:MAG TPA: hypothetical protein VGM03_03340 [Phycisphaerae bacterium]
MTRRSTEAEVQNSSGDNSGEVWFTLGDVVCPTALTVLQQIGPDLVVAGRITCFSDSGERRDHFAVVQVEGVFTPLIVPVSKLRTTSRSLPGGAHAPAAPQSDNRVDGPAEMPAVPHREFLEDSPAPP